MNRSQADPARTGRVVKDYRAQFADPIAVEAGEAFAVSERAEPWENNPAWMWVWCTEKLGKSGWVPQRIIQMETDGRMGTTQAAYHARELTVTAGQQLRIEREESGWVWCCDQQGTCGWVPISHVLAEF